MCPTSAGRHAFGALIFTSLASTSVFSPVEELAVVCLGHRVSGVTGVAGVTRQEAELLLRCGGIIVLYERNPRRPEEPTLK